MKIGIEGHAHADLFRVPPESIYIPGLDPHPDTGEAEPLENFSPYHRLRVNKPLDEDVIASMMEHGHLTPIATEKPDRTNNKFFAVMDGVQRLKNGRAANKRLVKRGDQPNLCEITIEVNVSPERRLAVMMGSNILRSDEDDQAHAEQAHWMIVVKKMEIGLVAGLFRKRKNTIKQWLIDRGFSDEIKAELAKGMEKTTARVVASLPLSKQAPVLEAARKIAAAKKGKGLRKDHISVRDVKAATKMVDHGFVAPTLAEQVAVIRAGIPGAALEVLLWTTGQGPMPAFLDAAQVEMPVIGTPVDASFDETEAPQ